MTEELAAEAATVSQPTDQPETIETKHEPIEVGLERSVRIGRIIITATILGALIGAGWSLLFPVVQSANYEMRHAVGIAAVYGAAIGLTLGALFALFLGIFARRKKGEAIAVQTDVR